MQPPRQRYFIRSASSSSSSSSSSCDLPARTILKATPIPRDPLRSRPRIRKSRISPPRSPRKPKRMLTTKDRIRRFVERNEVISQSMFMDGRQIERLLDVAEGRLSWFRNQIYGFWNPDYLLPEQQQSSTKTTTTSDSSLPQKQQEQNQRRAVTYRLVMDERWWFWNILFSMFPGLLIAFYCEFRGQPLMYEHHRQQTLHQMEKLMGKEYVEQHRDELAPIPDGLGVRVQCMLRELKRLFELWIQSGLTKEGGKDKEKNGMRSSEENSSLVEVARQAAQGMQSMGIGKHPEQEKLLEGAGVEVQEKRIGTSGGTTLSLEKPAVSPLHGAGNETRPTIEALLSRIEKLETTLEEQRHRQGVTERRDGDDRERLLKLQLERIQQSGSRNRMEDGLVEKWQQQLMRKQQQQHEGDVAVEDEKNSSHRNFSVLRSWASQRMRNMQQAQQQVLSVLNDALNASSSSTSFPDPSVREGNDISSETTRSNQGADKNAPRVSSTLPLPPHAIPDTPENIAGKSNDSDLKVNKEDCKKSWWRLW